MQSFGVDNAAYQNALQAELGGNWTVIGRPWKTLNLMVGGYATFPVSENISYEIKAMVGYLDAESPELTITRDGTSTWFKQNSASAGSLSYLLGIGFKFDVADKICILTSLDYTGAKPQFNDVVISGNARSPGTTSFSQGLGSVNLGVGIGFRL